MIEVLLQSYIFSLAHTLFHAFVIQRVKLTLNVYTAINILMLLLPFLLHLGQHNLFKLIRGQRVIGKDGLAHKDLY